MSFKTVAKFLMDYREERAVALNNEQVMPWSTTPVETMNGFVRIFSSGQTNAEWTKEYNAVKAGKAVSAPRVQSLRLCINFLAGCRRDVRIQFAVGKDNRVRVGADYDRFEYSRLAYGNYIMDLQDQLMDIRLKA